MARPRTKIYGYGQMPERTDIAYGSTNVKTLRREKIDVVQLELPPSEQFWFDRGGRTYQDEINSSTEAGPFFINGKRASDLEWRVYKALKFLGWRDESINFQAPILGGRRPGGQVLDFVVRRFGAVYVIPVNGEYWHRMASGASRTFYNEAAIKQAIPSARIIPLWTSDLLTDEMAISTLRILVGRGF